MAQYNFEGDVTGASDRQLEYINDVIKKLGFEKSKVTFEVVGAAGDNYASCVKRIIIQGEKETLKMIVKLAPSNEVQRMMMSAVLMFTNEHVMYTQVLPKFVQLQIDAGIPESEQLKYAKCYGTNLEPPNEVILLEDLAEKNFTMLDRFTPLSNDSVKSILKNFAIFHSLSFALKHQEPLTYENFKESLLDMWALQAETQEMKSYFLGLEEEALSILEDPEHINLVKHKVSDSINIILKFSRDPNCKYTVIVQGDAWTNNILFKMADDKPEKSIMIDYQISRNGSPVFDLMYMIFNCTDHESRKQHYYDWIDYYHTELEKSLSDLNLKANFVYPRDKLDADLKRYAKPIFGLSVCLASILIRKSDEAAIITEAMQSDNAAEQMKQMGVMALNDESKALFKERVIGLVHSFTEFGLL